MQQMRTMGRAGFVMLVGAALTVGSPRAADTPPDTDWEIEVGGELASVDEDRDSKFQEFRDVPQGAVIDRFHLSWLPASGPWHVRLDSTSALRLDERYVLTFGRSGRIRVTTSWDQGPQFLSRDSTWLLAGSPGDFTLANDFRQVIEDAALGGTVDSLMPDVLATSARPLDLRTRRDLARTVIGIDIGRGWDLEVTAAREKREGLARLGTGTYIRSGTAGSFDRERFTIRGLEMPEPVDTRATDVGLATSYRRGRGFFTLGWQGSRFSNEIDALGWDNPFEAAPSVASSSDRGRAAQNALDLWPDNTWERQFASGGFGLRGRTRVTATAARAAFRQNDGFLAFTRNEALFFPGPDGMLGTGDDVAGTDPSLLPATDLDGEVRTTRYDVRITSRPIDALSLRGTYRRYDYDDRSPVLFFPGYAAFGESDFRRGIGQTFAGSPALFNDVGGYTRSVWTAGGAYRFTRGVTLDLEYASTTWDYDRRQVERTQEDAYTVKLRIQPADWLAARLSWIDASRDFEGAYAGGFETSGVRAYDVWDRQRTRYGIDADFLPGDRWSFGVAFARWEDEYPGSVGAVTSFPYGLLRSESDTLAGYLSYAATRIALTLTLGRDTSLFDSLAVTKTTLASDAATYAANNRWTRTEDDTVDWGSVSIETTLIPDRLRLVADVTYTIHDGRLKTRNPDTPDVNSAVAYPYPAFRTDLVTGRLTLAWTLNRDLDFIARYWYEPFRLDDFMWDVVQPYMQGVTQEARTSPADIQDADVRRYLALDSRYSDYTANVLYAALRVHF
jgi:hypothetical protein